MSDFIHERELSTEGASIMDTLNKYDNEFFVLYIE